RVADNARGRRVVDGRDDLCARHRAAAYARGCLLRAVGEDNAVVRARDFEVAGDFELLRRRARVDADVIGEEGAAVGHTEYWVLVGVRIRAIGHAPQPESVRIARG